MRVEGRRGGGGEEEEGQVEGEEVCEGGWTRVLVIGLWFYRLMHTTTTLVVKCLLLLA